MAEFARKQLEKYGWTEGKGLGKEGQGISCAIKPCLKLNSFGIGHNESKNFTSRWWEDACNNALNNIVVVNKKDGVQFKRKKKKEDVTSVVKTSSGFVKGPTLCGITEIPVCEESTKKINAQTTSKKQSKRRKKEVSVMQDCIDNVDINIKSSSKNLTKEIDVTKRMLKKRKRNI